MKKKICKSLYNNSSFNPNGESRNKSELQLRKLKSVGVKSVTAGRESEGCGGGGCAGSGQRMKTKKKKKKVKYQLFHPPGVRLPRVPHRLCDCGVYSEPDR